MAAARGAGVARARIANVTGALMVGGVGDAAQEAAVARQSEALASVFDETLVARDDGSDDPLRLFGDEARVGRAFVEGLAHVLSNAQGDRVLVVTDDVPEGGMDVWLALVAWPERDGVVVVGGDGVGAEGALAAIYRREPVLAAARALLATPEASRAALDARLEAERVTLAALGLADLAAGASGARAGRGGTGANGSTRGEGR